MPATPIVLFSVILAILTSTSESSGSSNYVPGELLVRFAPKAAGQQRTFDEQNAILTSIGGGV
jgi:hypothetical protein